MSDEEPANGLPDKSISALPRVEQIIVIDNKLTGTASRNERENQIP